MTEANPESGPPLLDRLRRFLNGPTASWSERNWERLVQIVEDENIDPEDDAAVRAAVQRVSREIWERTPPAERTPRPPEA